MAVLLKLGLFKNPQEVCAYAAEVDAIGTATGTADLKAANGPFALTGLTLKMTVTVDGVAGSEQTITFAGSLADTDAIVAFIIGESPTDLTPSKVDGGGGIEYLGLSTDVVGNRQAITVSSAGTANTLLGFSTIADTTVWGTGNKVVTIIDIEIDGSNKYGLYYLET